MNTRNRPGDNALLEKSRRFVDSYADMILRISYTYLKSTHDAEDICQTVFLKCLEHPRTFHDEEHEKAWVIRCAINACKDALGKACRKTSLPIEAAACVEAPAEPERTDVLDAVMTLKVEYREAIYLHYFEGYSIKEIAKRRSRRGSSQPRQKKAPQPHRRRWQRNGVQPQSHARRCTQLRFPLGGCHEQDVHRIASRFEVFRRSKAAARLSAG